MKKVLKIIAITALVLVVVLAGALVILYTNVCGSHPHGMC